MNISCLCYSPIKVPVGVRITHRSARLEIGKQWKRFQTRKRFNKLPTELLQSPADGKLQRKCKSMMISQDQCGFILIYIFIAPCQGLVIFRHQFNFLCLMKLFFYPGIQPTISLYFSPYCIIVLLCGEVCKNFTRSIHL